jgi:putative sigma-54 modulation protein
MKIYDIEIRWRGIERSALVSERARRRARGVFRASARHIRNVVVRLEDLNGPKGGIDKRCTVEVRGTFGSHLTETRDADVQSAVDRALRMAGRSVLRYLDRRAERAPTSIRQLKGAV